MKHVLFVDDDRFYAYAWIEKLRSGNDFEVEHRKDAQSALDRVQTRPELDCVVLDVMMPTPEGVGTAETAEGFETGIWFLEQIADVVRRSPLPVVVLTNRDLPLIRGRVEKLRFDKGLVEIRHKLETPRDLLKQVVHDLVVRWRRATG